jgi:CBS domain containing-hemolysin-like protein
MMMLLSALLLLSGAFVFSGLDAAWQALDRVRLRHRADKGDRRAKAMRSWEAVRPQADLVLAWTSHALAAGALAVLAAAAGAGPGWWLVPAVFVPVYALLVGVLARQIFRRLPFAVLSRLWWLVTLAGSWWAPLARPVARLLRRVKPDPLPRPAAAEELMALVGQTEGVSSLEESMLRSVLDFRRMTAGSLALPVAHFPAAPADAVLGDLLGDRRVADAPFNLVLGPDGQPLGAMSCASAALSGAFSARAQSFARPLVSFDADLPAWKTLAMLRRAQTPVAEVCDGETGRFVGILTEESVVTRLLGQGI